MKALLIGFGEIGSSVYSVFSEKHEIYIYDPAKGHEDNPGNGVDLLLIAIPYTEGEFEDVVKAWQMKIRPQGTLIFSTVSIGTCRKLNACHFPIEGKHPNIERDIRMNQNHWLGGYNAFISQFLDQSGLKYRQLDKPEYTEFLKLRSTSYYGVCIEFARYSKQVADVIGLDEKIIHYYDMGYNILVQDRGDHRFIRPILTAPEGNIKGHCVVPNSKILDNQFPSEFLKMIYSEKE